VDEAAGKHVLPAVGGEDEGAEAEGRAGGAIAGAAAVEGTLTFSLLARSRRSSISSSKSTGTAMPRKEAPTHRTNLALHCCKNIVKQWSSSYHVVMCSLS
jgi:hypothetical protein